MFHNHTLRIALALGLAIILAGCGGGASDSVGPSDGQSTEIGTAPLVITTTSVPTGSPGVTYPTTSLQADGANGTVVWTVTDGTTPPGIFLTRDGRLTGTPASTGYFEFTAEASDGARADRQTLAVAVDAFGISVTDGLHYGDAWSGRPVQLRCAGHTGQAAYTIITNGSGGSFQTIDPQAGTATWVPGPTGVNGTTDILHVACSNSGESDTIELPVATDPTEHHTARFGECDVWSLDWNTKRGAHPFATDLQAAAASLGLRAAESVGTTSTEADRLAETLIQVEILRAINPLFLRNADGTSGTSGLPISFAFNRPGAGYVAPGRGGYMSGRSHGYSIMALCDQTGSMAAMGMAYGDDVGNPYHESNAPGGPQGDLGVFVNVVADQVSRVYTLHGSALQDAPINDDDIDVLKALLLGRASPGGRYEMIRYQVKALAESLAYVTAHEVGHSLGLQHGTRWTPGAIMNTTAIIGPGMDYHFTASSLSVLRQGLPGAGRGGVATQKAGTLNTAAMGLPRGGMHVCGGCSRGK